MTVNVMSNTPDIIAIMWAGPYKMGEISSGFKDSSDYGIYQIYATHNVYGPDALLYIGKAQDNSFGERIPAHKWTEWEASDVEVYLGRIAGFDEMTRDRW